MQRDGTRAALGYILPITLAALVLMLAGLESVRAWSPDEGQKQLVFLLFGVCAALAIQMVDYRTLLVTSWFWYGLSLLPVLYTIAGRYATVPFVKHEGTNGAWAWINFGPVSFQPSEVTKLALVLVLAWTLRGENESRSLWVLVRSLLISGISMALIMKQPDLGTVLTMIPPVLVMIYVAGVKKRHLVAMFGVGVLLAPLLWFSGHCTERENCELCPNVPVLSRLPQFVNHNQRSRVQAMFSNDARVLQGKGYQQERALESLGSGGVGGKGMGNIPTGAHIPECHTDMVVALIGEQFGLLGIGVVLLSYLLLAGSAIAIANEHREQPGKLLAVGLATLLVGQAALNLAVALRVMPVTGVTLPFVSYGGSSLMASCAAAGLLINVARNQRKVAF